MSYVLFGAGKYGKNALDILSGEDIAYFVDNDKAKSGTVAYGYPVYLYAEKKRELNAHDIVITVSEIYSGQIAEQLSSDGFTKYQFLRNLQIEATRRKIESRTDYVGIYHKAIEWIHQHTVEGQGIISSTGEDKSYPEVSGYYIPSLIHWGYRDLAVQYAKWLCCVQKPDGSWYDTQDTSPYVFDTAQILKGLLAVRRIYPFVDGNIRKGCDWILGNIQPSGRLTTPDTTLWGPEGMCSELIHLYCLSPLVDASDVLGEPRYRDAALKVLSYYKENHMDEIMNFGCLSHFYAYVMEALLDMGETALAREAMSKAAKLQDESGMVPAYKNVHWVCSTGLFQFALVWFRLGEIERGRKAFDYACKLQNNSGGWYGSYPTCDSGKEEHNYFPDSEISWAAKFFLDALYWKNKAIFEIQAPSFFNNISQEDGRYRIIENEASGSAAENPCLKIADIGCGKGAYLKNIIKRFPQASLTAVDLSENVMEYLDDPSIEKIQGTLTDIPVEDKAFDIVFTCEALEHAIDIDSAIREMARVTKPGGKMIVIDKNKASLGALEIEEWEQWFDELELKSIISKYCNEVKVISNIPYAGKAGNLFSAWVGTGKI